METLRAEAFKSLYGVTTQKEILELFRADCVEHKSIKNNDEAKEESASKLFSKYALALTYLYSLATIKQNLKNYKKIISELRLGSVVQDKFYFVGLFTTVSKKTKANEKKRKEVDKALPVDVRGEIRRVQNLLRADAFDVKANQTVEQVRSYYIVYVLGLATGRRFSEIIKTISIQKRGKKFFFKGLLKKEEDLKNKAVEAHFVELSYTAINAYLKELRSYISTKLKKDKGVSLEDISESEINTIFSKVYNNAVKRISDNKVPNVHELRHFYTIEHQERYLAKNPHLKLLNKKELEVVLQNVRYTVLAHEIKEDTTSSYVTIK